MNVKLENDVWIQTEFSPEKESANNCDRDLDLMTSKSMGSFLSVTYKL